MGGEEEEEGVRGMRKQGRGGKREVKRSQGKEGGEGERGGGVRVMGTREVVGKGEREVEGRQGKEGGERAGEDKGGGRAWVAQSVGHTRSLEPSLLTGKVRAGSGRGEGEAMGGLYDVRIINQEKLNTNVS